ncbi:MAG: hypothetical protein JO337_11545 [Acidimicrobiales bacterium]|nr:hypothetical protein [Acidimicrobiales bacterium]
MSDLPVHPGASSTERPPGLALTPAERQARTRNRQWLLIIVIVSVVLLVLALAASAVAESNTPSAPSAVPPAGYQTVNDGYFSYAIPSGWSVNQLYTDSAGDSYRSGSGEWAGEHIGFRGSAPVVGEPQPETLAAFGMNRPQPYTLTGGHPIDVPGAAAAFRYDLTRPGGFRATAIDAWNSRYGVELWLVVDAPSGVTEQIVSHLRA